MGIQAAAALRKGAESAGLRTHAGARVALGWLRALPDGEHQVPGLPGVRVSLKRSEGGVSAAVVGTDSFSDCSAPDFVPTVVVLLKCLGAPQPAPLRGVRSDTLRRFGSAVDALVASKLRRAEPPGRPGQLAPKTAAPIKLPDPPDKPSQRQRKRVAGGQLPGVTAPAGAKAP